MSSSRNKAIVRYNTGESVGTAGPSNSTEPSAKRRAKQDNDAKDVSLRDEDVNRIVNDCVKYVIISDKKLPIKRSDIIKAVTKQPLNRKTTEEIMKEVASKLVSIFGIRLVESPEISGSVSYILVNKLAAEKCKQAVNNETLPKSQLLQSSLLSCILSVIFMNGGIVNEDVVWKFLTRLRFDVSPKSKKLITIDDYNGITLRKLVTDVWVRQLYLKYSKIERSDPIVHQFRWGFRAQQEFSKMDILKFVCRLYNDGSTPQSWSSQYEIALKEEQKHNTNGIEDDDEIELMES